MEYKDLIARYLYAVTKNLPKKSRREIAGELELAIAELLEGRCGQVEPGLEDVRAVLTELGAPSALADQYDPDRRNCLIGGACYTQYKLVLKIVLLSVFLGLSVAGVVTMALGAFSWSENLVSWPGSLASWLATLIQTLVSAFAWVTVIFAVLYHKGVKMEEKPERLEDLPPVPEEKLTISRGESVFGIAVSIIFALIFLLVPQVIFVYLDEGGAIPVFDVIELQKSWYLVAGLTFMGIIKESLRLIDGRYTRRVMVGTLITNSISALLGVLWLHNGRLINPSLAESLHRGVPEEGEFLVGLISNAHQVFLGILIFSLVLDGAQTFYKTLKYEEAWR